MTTVAVCPAPGSPRVQERFQDGLSDDRDMDSMDPSASNGEGLSRVAICSSRFEQINPVSFLKLFQNKTLGWLATAPQLHEA